ncbi:flagellar biosynthetic protein FliO [Microbacterium sp. UFMG61]|uniref:flagellar biosynthetic protein FliO n=1 Tax=Microbacterium sp. UFMG61 TaxID=2745935 RepID=UPI00188F24A7|nr:flagellar biosynthetic protein FliO [Microbacterium sp. UFMG61]
MDDLLVALRAVVALAAVLGLLLFLSRRLQKSHNAGGSPLAGLMSKKLARLTELRPPKTASGAKPRAEKITVVARSGIGGKAQLVVAEFGGIRYVLGVTEHGINVVDTQEAPLVEDDEIDEAAGATDELPNDIVDRALRSVA